VAVEWPRKAIQDLLPPTVEVVIEVGESEGRRICVRRLAS
jgi:hypothetical protein